MCNICSIRMTNNDRIHSKLLSLYMKYGKENRLLDYYKSKVIIQEKLRNTVLSNYVLCPLTISLMYALINMII